MHSLRHVAVRSAASASRAIGLSAAARQQFAVQLRANGSRLTKASSISVGRYFSQTARVANVEEEGKSHLNAEGSVTSHVSENATRSNEVTGATEAPARPVRRPDPPNGIFVQNMVFDVTEEHMMELFSQYGTIVECKLVRDGRGLSRGFGFVYMSTPEEQQRACQELNGTFWHGRRLTAAKQAPKPPRTGRGGPDSATPPTRFLYIGNIPYESTDAELNRIFQDLENMTDVRVAVDRVTGWPRGFAHADFADVESAQKAMAKLSGIELGSRVLRVDFATGPEEVAKRRQPRNPGGEHSGYRRRDQRFEGQREEGQ